jgi:predicted nucleotidyltransferase component of viral defense system
MNRRAVTNVAASVRSRLLHLAREQEEDFGLLLSRYAIQRLLYRLSQSRHAEDFILKGAQLFAVWMETPHRTTRDLDLLCRGTPVLARVEGVFRELCQQQVAPPDGLTFRADSVRAEATRETAAYDGIRVLLEYELSGARDRVQVDVGFGDAVVPPPESVVLPALLDLPAPPLRAYPREAVVAEKYEAMVTLGLLNSRMKDFYDVWGLARQFCFEGERLCQALGATFSRRGTPLPSEPPVALSSEFSESPEKQTQWRAFLRRTKLPAETDLAVVGAGLRAFLLPPTRALLSGEPFLMVWSPPQPWQPRPEA